MDSGHFKLPPHPHQHRSHQHPQQHQQMLDSLLGSPLTTAVLLLGLVLARIHRCLPYSKRPKGLREAGDAQVAARGARAAARQHGHGPGGTFVTMVVLGSGGHTSEMLKLMQDAPPDTYAPIHYIIAATDHTSADRIPHASSTIGGAAAGGASAAPAAAAAVRVTRIPRSREVGQSWASTFVTTARALARCALLVARVRPDVLLVNGPGTCMPICVCMFALKVLGVRPRGKIVFVESFCRVRTLSLTGKLLYPVADRFIVHWPELLVKYPRAQCTGQLL